MDAFSRIIALPSVSCMNPLYDQSNRDVVELLANWFGDLGFSTELQLVSSNPDKLNLIACYGQGEGGLVLSGHTDTVPYNENLWKQDPFKLTERDNKLYGLGSTDMKGFFPIVLAALEKIDLKKLDRPLFILATCDEESTMGGAKALVSSKRALGRHALIGEPTGLKPISMHKGILIESIKLIGQSGHSSDPSLGVNALEGMNTVINQLSCWRDELQRQEQNPLFKVPVPTMNFASIQGGDNPNRICGDCEMTIDLRMLPGMDLQECRAGIRKTVMQAIDGRGLTVEFDEVFSGSAGMHTDENAEIIKLAEKLAGEPTGTVAFGTEGPYLNEMGMDTVVLGPGDIDQAHQANEYIPTDRIEPMIAILEKMITHFCIKKD
jgi:acetylornithine deacetylase